MEPDAPLRNIPGANTSKPARSKPMLTLLRMVSARDYRAAPARLALIVGGIGSGVALIAALGIINASVIANFRAMLERAAGKAALQVVLGTGEVGFPESTVDLVKQDAGVQQAFGLTRGTLASTDGSGEVLQLFGIDAVSDAMDSYDVRTVERKGDEVEILNDPTSVFLTEEYAAGRHIALGDRVAFGTPTGVHELRVRALLRPEGIATVFGGALAVMDLPAAQRLLDKPGRVDQIDVLLKADAEATTVQRRLSAQLPSSLTVVRPAFRGERFERVVGAFQAMIDGLSLLGLLAGVFIVYNTSATAITQRARDLAIIIALGAERRTIFGLIVAESAIIGAVASVVGIFAGLGLARLLLNLVAQSMGVIYQMRFSLGSLTMTSAQVVWYTALGTVGAIAAALVPAYKASRLDPLDLMRPDFRERLAITSPNRLLVGVWLVLIACAGAAISVESTTRSIGWGNIGNIIWSLSGVVISIPVMSWTTRLLHSVLPRLFGLEGRIAVESLTRSPGRTGVTTAVIALSLALAIAVSSVARSFRESERSWFILAGDLVVSAVATEGGWLESPLSGDVADTLRAMPRVARVETYRVLPGQDYHGSRIAAVAVSPGFIDTSLFRQQIIAGNAQDAVNTITRDSGVVISDNLADRFRLRVGESITLPTPTGNETLAIHGIVAADYSGDQGSVIMHRDRFARLWGDTKVSHFNVFLTPGADSTAVRARIAHDLGQSHLVKILTVPQTLAYHQGMVDRAFAFTYAIQLLVVVVTLAGIFDLLTTQILERRREVGVFRAVGSDDWRIARSIRLEALVIGTVGAVLGCILGVGTSLLWVHVNFRILIGYVLEHHYAVLTAIWCLVLAAGVAMLAGQLAARRALREPALDALRYE
jgi:putative ABC transport system permease protein